MCLNVVTHTYLHMHRNLFDSSEKIYYQAHNVHMGFLIWLLLMFCMFCMASKQDDVTVEGQSLKI